MEKINNMAMSLASKRSLLSNCGGISYHAATIFQHEHFNIKGSKVDWS